MASARPGPSRQLPRGRHTLAAETVAAQQRARLHEAAVELLAERGYSATTVQDLTTTAGISSITFYELFSGKSELVLDAFDALIASVCATLRERPVAEGALRVRLAAVLTAVVEAILAQPAAARMALVEVAAVGQPGLTRRRALTSGLHELLRGAATVDGAPAMSEAALTVLAGGTLHVFDGHLRAGRLRPLRPAAAELAAWGAMYESASPRRLPARDPLLAPPPVIVPSPLPRGRHGLPPGYVRRHQRARILDAVLEVSAQHGFEAASVRELIVAAGLSTEAFYSHFPSKEDAWDTVFDQAFVELFAAVWHAALAESGRTAKVTAAVDAGLGLLAASPEQARLLLVDAPTAGRVGLPAIDDALKAFTRVIAGATAGPKDLPKSLPGAMAAGLAELVAGWVLDGRATQLPELRSALVEIILTPPLGLAAAARAADAGAASGDAAEPAIARDDRRLLMDAFAEAVARNGLSATRLSDVAQQAGVELDVAQALFTDELDCAAQALNAWAGRLVVVAAGAFLTAAGDPPLAAHRALEAALNYIARTPALAALVVTDEPELIPAVFAMRDRYISLFFQLIAVQVPVAGQEAPQPLAALGVVLDGVMAVLRRFAQQGRIAELPSELPTLSLQVLTPFFGADEARRVAEPAVAAR
jgi:TetR/AcrR family transcriptional regulator